MNLLEISGLKVEFAVGGGHVKALDGVSLNVAQGKITAIVGESGSGKSTLAQAVLGILPRNARVANGQILFRDPKGKAPVDLALLDPKGAKFRGLRGARIAMIFQEPMTSFSPLHTVGDQIAEVLAVHKSASGAEARRAAIEALGLCGVPEPERAFSRYPFELSGGLRQRAMIAMALVCRPALLVADEPTTALDVTIQAQILKLIKDLQSELDLSVLLITHDLGVVANMADDVTVLFRGRVVESGEAAALLRAPEHPYLRALLHAEPRIGMAADERLTPLREVHTLPPADAKRAKIKMGEPLIELKSAVKRFGSRLRPLFGSIAARETLAVAGVDLSLMRGECLGLVGESGCGKSTLTKIMLGAIAPDEGEVLVESASGLKPLHSLTGAEEKSFRRRVQLVFQDPYSSLNPRMTILDTLREPLVIHGVGNAASQAARAEELMRLVGLDPRSLRRYPHSFSGGQRQRIGIARALALEPEILICDEPVSALDVSVQAQILNLIKDLKAHFKLTVLFISHNLAVVDYVADRIAVMCRGRIVEIAPFGQLFEKARHPYTKALIAAIPSADPGARLDLTALMGGRASDPAQWPEPFRLEEGEKPRLVRAGERHHVAVNARADALDAVR